MSDEEGRIRVGRRAFVQGGALVLAAMAGGPRGLWADENGQPVRVGLVTDLHYADKPSSGGRHYRETLRKLEEAAAQFERDRPAMIVELGDLIDAADSVEVEKGYLETVNRRFSAISDNRHYVLGNHCVDTLRKEEFLDGVHQAHSYYSFDRGGIHFVVLDSCFRTDGEPYGRRNFQWTDANIPGEELEWLEADLAADHRPTVVFAHQRLDVSNDHGVRNNAQVRRALEASGRVVAVFQGHSHRNDLKEIGGIHYCTLVAMVEGSGTEHNGYALMDIEPNGTIRVRGFRKQHSYSWERQR